MFLLGVKLKSFLFNLSRAIPLILLKWSTECENIDSFIQHLLFETHDTFQTFVHIYAIACIGICGPQAIATMYSILAKGALTYKS